VHKENNGVQEAIVTCKMFKSKKEKYQIKSSINESGSCVEKVGRCCCRCYCQAVGFPLAASYDCEREQQRPPVVMVMSPTMSTFSHHCY